MSTATSTANRQLYSKDTPLAIPSRSKSNSIKRGNSDFRGDNRTWAFVPFGPGGVDQPLKRTWGGETLVVCAFPLLSSCQASAPTVCHPPWPTPNPLPVLLVVVKASQWASKEETKIRQRGGKEKGRREEDGGRERNLCGFTFVVVFFKGNNLKVFSCP